VAINTAAIKKPTLAGRLNVLWGFPLLLLQYSRPDINASVMPSFIYCVAGFENLVRKSVAGKTVQGGNHHRLQPAEDASYTCLPQKQITRHKAGLFAKQYAAG
jgi:hypothetical protein